VTFVGNIQAKIGNTILH